MVTSNNKGLKEHKADLEQQEKTTDFNGFFKQVKDDVSEGKCNKIFKDMDKIPEMQKAITQVKIWRFGY